METPNKEKIFAVALEMFHEQRAREGDPSFDVNPTEEELKEDGFWSAAVSEAMRDNARTSSAEWRGYVKQKNPMENSVKIEMRKENFFDLQECLDTGFFVSGTSQCGKSNLAKILVQSLLNFGVTVYVMDTSQAWNDGPIRNITEVSRDTENYHFGTSTVFDLSTLQLRDKAFFVNSICKHVFAAHVAGYRRNEFLVFEEAQTYMPNGSFRLSIRRNPIYEGAVNIVTVGANYGIRFGLITQFPSMVDKAPVKIAMQRYFGWTLERNDTQYIKSFIGKENLTELSNLQKGQFIYQNRGTISKIETQKFGQKTERSTNSFSFPYESWNVPIIQN